MNSLFNIFAALNLPYFRQGSLSDADYPSSFFTFFEIDAPNASFYDNNETRNIEYVQVCFYTNNASLIYSKMDEFITAAKNAGFVVHGKAHDTNADKANYYGRLVYVSIINKY